MAGTSAAALDAASAAFFAISAFLSAISFRTSSSNRETASMASPISRRIADQSIKGREILVRGKDALEFCEKRLCAVVGKEACGHGMLKAGWLVASLASGTFQGKNDSQDAGFDLTVAFHTIPAQIAKTTSSRTSAMTWTSRCRWREPAAEFDDEARMDLAGEIDLNEVDGRAGQAARWRGMWFGHPGEYSPAATDEQGVDLVMLTVHRV